jgi:hypothetical protein
MKWKEWREVVAAYFEVKSSHLPGKTDRTIKNPQ